MASSLIRPRNTKHEDLHTLDKESIVRFQRFVSGVRNTPAHSSTRAGLFLGWAQNSKLLQLCNFAELQACCCSMFGAVVVGVGIAGSVRIRDMLAPLAGSPAEKLALKGFLSRYSRCYSFTWNEILHLLNPGHLLAAADFGELSWMT